MMTDRKFMQLGKSATAILAGDEDLTQWTDEELLRGQRKSNRGRFEGSPPRIIPTAVYQELMRRRLFEVSATIREAAQDAASYLASVVKGEVEPDAVKVRAADSLLDRFIGRAPQHVRVDVTQTEAPWQKALRLSIVGSVDQASQRELDETISDAEVIEPDDAYPSDEFDDDYVIDPDDEIIDPIEPPNANNERYPPGPYDARWRRRDV